MAVYRHLDDDLNRLRSLLDSITTLVDEQFANAVQALLDHDVELARDVVATDDDIDALELQIDDLCERILARHQPVAADLRMIITAIKINTDLERIGDHCKSLAHGVEEVTYPPELLACMNLKEMVDTSRSMLRDMQDAFQNRDRLLARKVIARDQHVNRLHRDNFEGLITFSRENEVDPEPLANLIAASKALERISDHTKNVAESVVFLIEGKDIRHRAVQREQEKADASE